jgi:hypothetical protein
MLLPRWIEITPKHLIKHLLPLRISTLHEDDSTKADATDFGAYFPATLSMVYQPLKAPRSIRLLTIIPGTEGDRIQILLAPIELDKTPPFEALSYCWGSPEPSVKITCNGEPMNVTPNIAAALEMLRFPDQTDIARVFWIDFICINEDDLDERAQQVSFMKDVYSRAKKVIVWLGKSRENTATAASWFPRAATYYQEAPSLEDVKAQVSTAQSKGMFLPDDPKWSRVCQLLDAEWFSRLWVLQEVIRAKAAVVMIGKHLLPWTYVPDWLPASSDEVGLDGFPSWVPRWDLPHDNDAEAALWRSPLASLWSTGFQCPVDIIDTTCPESLMVQ